MDKIDDEFGEIDTAQINLEELDLPEIESVNVIKIGTLRVIDFEPDECENPEDTKWNQVIKVPNGAIIEVRSSNPSVPDLKLGVKVIYGSELRNKIARIAGFEERKKEETEGMDTPIIVLKDGEQTIRIYDPRSILRVEDPLPANRAIPNEVNWVQANFSVHVPDAYLTTYFRGDYQEDSRDNKFFVAVKGNTMLVRTKKDKSFDDAEMKVSVFKDSKPIYVLSTYLSNGYKYVTLPENIKNTDVIEVRLFKMSKP